MRRRALTLALATAAILLLDPGLRAEPLSRGPVPLLSPGLATPPETAGSGLSPTVDVILEIDTRGRPTSVEIVGIRPASSFDERFAAAARETLLQWRYAPAVEAGVPRPASQNLSVQFRALSDQDAETGATSAIHTRQAALAFRERTLALAPRQLADLQDAKANQALHYMDKARVRPIQSPRFNVLTDAPSTELGRAVANNLETGFNFVRDLLGSRVPPQPGAGRIAAFVYASRSAFEAMQADVEGLESSVAGFYSPVGLVAFQVQMVTDEELLEVMLHEGTHAYVDRHLARPGVTFPRWLDEGLASYVGNSKIGANNKLVPGKIRKKQTIHTSIGSFRVKSNARFGLEETKLAIRKGEAIPLRELVGSTREEFYGERIELYYTMAWLLVHYLRHGEPGWAERQFPDLVLYVAEGYAPADVFEAIYGDPDQFEAGFVRYVRQF